MFEYEGIKIRWHGHDSFSLVGNVIIMVDPFKMAKQEKADLVLISHNHFDHCSVDDIKNVSTNGTSIVAAKECIEMIKGFDFKEKIGISPGEEKTVKGIKIKSIPAYNITKIILIQKNRFIQKK